MKYKIDFFEEAPTKNGVMKANVSVTDEKGVQTDKVTLWASNWPNFKTLAAGHEVEGEIKVTVNGQYTNTTLYPVATPTAKPVWAGGKGGAMAAVKEKAKNIVAAQENKQEGIKISSTFRDATLITLAQFEDIPFEEADFKKKWLEWRSWLWKHFDTDESNEALPF